MSRLIFYGVDDEARRAHLLEAAEAQAIDVREVKKEEVGELLGYFAGLEGYEKTGEAAEAPEEELLVFVGLHSHDLQKILLTLREMGEVFPHKAAMTETNKDWPFARLVTHIRRENAIIQAWSQMMAVAKEVIQAQETEPTQARDEALTFAKDLRLKGEDIEESDVREAIRRLKESL
ncbi:DUF3783 domain-containing protein [Peptoniphilus sp. EMRHCC_23]|uniref:DUF3783 domain-containing protein n=1 Tax=Peptoniphilus rachelemmaiella TaxID=2811779 RepID=UPI001C008337|nr:DUF3783 domain-containing protein [Peptoniphilus rachelemmaiella]